MKYFTITPDDISPELITACLPRLRQQGVSHLYLRAQSLHTELARLIPLIEQHAIVPVIPRVMYRSSYAQTCAVHTRSTEHFEPLGVPGLVQTASCHSAEQARALLDSGADYVFISPVYRPASKPGDMRPLIATDALRMLAQRYKQRLVLLGGLTLQRIDELRTLLDADFSVAGISMFFSTGTTDGKTSPAQIYINDETHSVGAGTTLAQVRAHFCPDATAAILNTVPNPPAETILRDHDRVYLYEHAVDFAGADLRNLILARQPHAATEKLRTVCVGIAGAGGLGSVVAENLARAGVGKLVIADFDAVEPSNLNRQRYFLRQLGLPKAEALADNLRQCCPFAEVDAVHERISADNCVRVFGTCAIVCECFDAAESKAALVTALRSRLPDCIVVAASGLAGCGSAGSITIRRVSDKLYIVGDQHSDSAEGAGLFAARVGIAASMQAHVVVQLILGEQI